MKRMLALLILFAAVHPLYSDPPVANITIWNNGRAVELDNLFEETFSKSEVLDTGICNFSINGSMVIAGISPLVDNTTTYGNETRVIVGRGQQMGRLIGFDGGLCGTGRSAYDAACDFDGDGCAEVEKEIHAFSVVGITFEFRNLSEYAEPDAGYGGVLGEQYKYSVSNVVILPGNISLAMESASGGETITVHLNGTMTYVYAIDDREKSGLDCITKYRVFEKTVWFSDSRPAYAGGRRHLFFVETPPVNEQWFRNNELSIIVLSQRKIYRAELYKNESAVLNTRLYDFNVTENYFGISEIVSVPNNPAPFLGSVNVTPTPLEHENNTFAYLYRFNYSYAGELGGTEFRLEITDVFLGNGTEEQKTYGRQLSYGNKTETGTNPAWETTRKSVVAEKQMMEFTALLFGMLGVAVLLIFLRFRRR